MGIQRAVNRRSTALALLSALLTVLVAAGSGATAAGDTTRASIGSLGQTTNDSNQAALSANGQFVAFKSIAPNLVAGDTNGIADVFVKNRLTGAVTRVSVDSAGVQASSSGVPVANNANADPAISADGKVVAFTSTASNLVAGDTNGVRDIFVHDLSTSTTTRVSIPTLPLLLGQQAGGNSTTPAVSADGRYVVYATSANNIVLGDVNGAADVFRYDRLTGTTIRISQSSLGIPSGIGEESAAPAVSGDGNFVVFLVTPPCCGGTPDLDAADTNLANDIYLRDVSTGTTRRVSVPNGGGLANGGSLDPTISLDGSTIAFSSDATNLVGLDTNANRDVFVVERVSGAIEKASVTTAGAQALGGGAASENPALSSDGSYVAYESAAANLVAGDTNGVRDIFVRNRSVPETTRESLAYNGLQVSLASVEASISGDGKLIAFTSYAPNLVASDTNAAADVFWHELGVADITPPSVTGAPDRPANGDGWYNANVAIDWTATDPTPSAGPASDPPNTTAATEGKDVVYTSAPSCDPNANCATGTLKLSIDKTLPTITATRSPANSFGWNDDTVIVGFDCSDALSGLVSCAPPVTISGEGASQTASGTAKDRAENQKTLVVSSINIDKTPPSIAFVGANSYTINQNVFIDCQASDALSGLDEETAITPEQTSCPDTAGPASTFGPGTHTVNAYAVDKAGLDASAAFTFTVTATPQDIIDLICNTYLTKRYKQFCRKLTHELEKAQAYHAAGNFKQRDEELRKFLKTGAKEVGKLITAAQMAQLVQIVQSITGP